MINIGDEIKNLYEVSTTQADKIIVDGIEHLIYEVEYEDNCYNEGNIFGTAMSRSLEFKIDNSVNLEGKEFEYLTGIKQGENFEWISLGNFIVTEVEPNDTKDENSVVAMDYMIKSNIIYKSTLPYGNNIKILDVLIEATTQADLVLGTTEFTNMNFVVDKNQFEENTLIRQVFQAIAQISGTVCKIKSDNKLYFINPLNNVQVSKIFNLNNYSDIEIKRTTRRLNAVCLGISGVEGENVVLRDEESIAQNGENFLVINDNPFAYTEEKRIELIQGIYDSVIGFEYTAFSMNCQGVPYMETLDKIQIKEFDGTTHDSYILRYNTKSPNGLNSTIEAPSIIKATVNYQNLANEIEMNKKTEFIVDKSNQKISTLITDLGTTNSKVNRIDITVSGFDERITQASNEAGEAKSLSHELSVDVAKLRSEIGDVTDITVLEKGNGILQFENINESEPISIKINATDEDISYLYPSTRLFPNQNLFFKTRTLRFTNTETNEIFDYELPGNLRYLGDVHDEFVYEFESQTCKIIKRIGINENMTKYVLDEEITTDFEFPIISLSTGNYTVKVVGYQNAYLEVRLMSQNMYTSQFVTKLEMRSTIEQTTSQISANVTETLTGYSTKSETNSKIDMRANQIQSSVAQVYETKASATTTKNLLQSQITQNAGQIELKVSNSNYNHATIVAKINDNTSSAKISADKIDIEANDILNLLAGNIINMTSKNITISSDYFKVNKYGSVEIKNGTIEIGTESKTKINTNGIQIYNNSVYIGSIGKAQWATDNSQKGIVFHLENEGSYMAWARKSRSSDVYHAKLYYTNATFGENNEGVYLGTTLYGKGHDLHGFNVTKLSSEGYNAVSGTIPVITSIYTDSSGILHWTSSEIRVRNGIVTAIPS